MKITLKMIFVKWLFFFSLLAIYSVVIMKQNPIPVISMIIIYVVLFSPLMLSEELQKRGDIKKELDL